MTTSSSILGAILGDAGLLDPNGTKVKRSCLSCPSYVSPEAVAIATGKSIGTGFCRTREIALGMPSWSKPETQSTLEAVGTACDDYGVAPTTNLQITKTTKVMAGDYDALIPSENRLRAIGESYTDREANLVSSCNSCMFFVKPSLMASETGITAGLCKAKNQLVRASEVTTESVGCAYKTYAGATKKTALDEAWPFGPGLSKVDDLFAEGSVVLSTATVVEPNDWATQANVSDEDDAAGIQAWRKITDPTDPKRSVYLPVFRNDFFTEEEQSKIPRTGDREHPELYLDYTEAVYKVAILWMALEETPAVWGEPGVGKTELFRHLAWMMQVPFERISITATSEVDDLAGKMMFTPETGTYFQYGRIPAAWTKPCVLVIDEPNVGPPEVWHFIRPLTDNSAQMVLDMNKGERIAKHDFCFMGMAMNPAWDPRNVGAETVADADSSRLMHIQIGLPPQHIEKQIIRDRLAVDGWAMSETHLDQLMKVAGEIRELSSNDSVPITWGPRAQLKVARALQYFSATDAYRIAATDFLEPDVADTVLQLVRLNITGDF